MLKITLEAARVNAGLNQKEAAKLLHISNKTLQNWESGKSYPNADKIAEICELYVIAYDNIKFLPNRSLKANN
jgi:transcriptional regulator with XRE-family HTH domain